jgi:hypothetical protein
MLKAVILFNDMRINSFFPYIISKEFKQQTQKFINNKTFVKI